MKKYRIKDGIDPSRTLIITANTVEHALKRAKDEYRFNAPMVTDLEEWKAIASQSNRGARS